MIEAASVVNVEDDITFPLTNEAEWIDSADNIVVPKATLLGLQNKEG